ncbi:hypothetical protein ES706_02362 [subsurface metagenome]
MKRILMITVALALLAIVAFVPASSAAPEYEARVKDPSVPLTIVGASYAVGDRIIIAVKVTNTGTKTFGSDVGCVVMVSPNPVEPGDYVYWGWTLVGMTPGRSLAFSGPEGGLPLNYTGTYEVLVTVLWDSDASGTYDYPSEVISNEATDTFTVGTDAGYSATVEIMNISAAALGGLAALGGGLLGVRFF